MTVQEHRRLTILIVDLGKYLIHSTTALRLQ